MLGYLNPAYFVGGTMAIDMAAAEAAMRPLAERAGLSVAGLAWGIHDVVNENMASAARVHIAEHGKDPRRYALLVHRRRRPGARLLRGQEAGPRAG